MSYVKEKTFLKYSLLTTKVIALVSLFSYTMLYRMNHQWCSESDFGLCKFILKSHIFK